MASGVRSQNLSIMLTDIQGYSATAANASREEVVELIRRHSQLMKPVIEFYGGTIVKSIGDAFLCTFPSATDAVICAIIIQLLLKEYNQKVKEEAKKLILRVVINSGDVSIEENDIFGNAVNITARMEALDCFPGGTIGISESTHLLMDRSEIVAEKIGPQNLKGVPEPVMVYKVPLEKQKLNQLPMQLLNLVEKVVNAKGSDAMPGSAQINEWAQSVGSFLKQTNWGDNLGKAQQQLGNIQKSLTKTFGKKTVTEQKKAFSDAPLPSRIKSGVIDMVIVTIMIIGMWVAWWPVQRVLFGSPTISNPVGISTEGWAWKEVGGEYVYVRPRGLVEWVVDVNVKYPFLLMLAYFSIFWKIKQATPGQIAAGTAVVCEDGSTTIPAAMALKRSAMFLVSCFTIFGLLMIFIGEKKTLYDKICQTRVVS
ncbi:MAG: adenylate/guanylate cyclase domain-containing protein [Candidatus Rifleibacteriota bacterium]